MNIGLIGHGYWGKNILRNLIEHSTTGKIILCDIDELKLIHTGYNNFPVQTTKDADLVFADLDIQAIVIATPTSTHYTLVKKALNSGKHVLVEKPFCTSVPQAEELAALAEQKGLKLVVDHIYLYNPVVTQLKQILRDEYFGQVNYIDSTRVNLGIYQKDTNVLWDLAYHDVYMISFLVTEKPMSVRAIGRTNKLHEMEDIVYLFLYYASGLLVQINSSWASPVKMRKMIVGGDKKMIIFDDIEPTNKLTIYDYNQANVNDSSKALLIDYRLGNITIPKCDIKEPLKNLIDAFYISIQKDQTTISDAAIAIETIAIVEAAQKSLLLSGELVSLQLQVEK